MKETKYCYFFILGLNRRDMSIFLFFTNHYHWWLRRGPRWWKWWFRFFSSLSSHCQPQNLSARNKNRLILLHKRSVSLSWKWPILAILQCKMAKIWVGGTGRFPGSNLIFFFHFWHPLTIYFHNPMPVCEEIELHFLVIKWPGATCLIPPPFQVG